MSTDRSRAEGTGPTLFVSAGDASGDQHAAALVAELRARRPELRFVGFGGPRLREAGVELFEPLAESPVMGFAAVVPALGRFVRLLNGADRWLATNRPAAVVAVDYPGFNVRLARLAKRRGIPSIYYICPQYWGWAPWRAHRFARAVDLVLTILPFEADFLADYGVSARHVGHPLADRLAGVPPPAAAAAALAVLPGSRRREIEHHLGWQLSAARRLAAAVGHDVAAVATHPRADVRERMAAIARAQGVALEVGDEPLPALLGRCRAAIVTSGTATLECALMRVPSVILYRVNGFSLWASRFLLTSPWIGLPNLLAGERILPEHLAARDPAEAIARDLVELWRDGDARERCLRKLDALRAALLVPGAAARAAEAVLDRLRA